MRASISWPRIRGSRHCLDQSDQDIYVIVGLVQSPWHLQLGNGSVRSHWGRMGSSGGALRRIGGTWVAKKREEWDGFMTRVPGSLAIGTGACSGANWAQGPAHHPPPVVESVGANPNVMHNYSKAWWSWVFILFYLYFYFLWWCKLNFSYSNTLQLNIFKLKVILQYLMVMRSSFLHLI